MSEWDISPQSNSRRTNSPQSHSTQTDSTSKTKQYTCIYYLYTNNYNIISTLSFFCIKVKSR
ncbi:hypothetical protein FQR65_LT08114 [Abscondita terminalis]|nr:hypothetical protein FQR65_LT08114 [Abscondita terminalis]